MYATELVGMKAIRTSHVKQAGGGNRSKGYN